MAIISNHYYTICIGTGEIGRPIYELANGVFLTLPIDPVRWPGNEDKMVPCDFMHICIPGELPDFDEIVLGYIDKYKPDHVFIHSTVAPGTGDFIQKNQGHAVILSSPVHGKHHDNQMKKDMLRYPKYVGVPPEFTRFSCGVTDHLGAMGFADVRIIEPRINVEWLKVLSTTYFGLIIAWHQEIERICDEFDLEFDAVIDIFKHQDDIKPPHYAGIIGGHCVMPNVKVIKEIWSSDLMDWIEKSNELKRKRDETTSVVEL